jgi:nucleotide-binding universal stress UspA family protein
MASKILVPTDFSPCANYAASLAIELAAKIKASVHFFHAAPVHPFWNELTEQEKLEFPTSFAEMHDMKSRFDDILQTNAHKGVAMETSYAAGNLLTATRKLIDDEGMDLVVMGSHGASGMQEIVFGSNAQKLVRHAHCPVMVVKHETQADFQRIVFASDFSDEAIPAFEWLVRFAKVTGAELLLLHIIPEARFGGKDQLPPVNFEPFLARTDTVSVSTQSYSDMDIEAGITNFSKRVNADLVISFSFLPSF